jgi:uncharacterized protein YdhG (YjbR/CyaY superfamily)
MPTPRSRKTALASPATEIRAYFDGLPPAARRHLTALRNAVRASVPEVEEAFSYRIPACRVDGRVCVWYAAFKEHVSLYPIGAAIRTAHAEALEGYKTATGTVQFPLSRPIPVALVKKLVTSRLAEMRAAASKRAAGTKKATAKPRATKASRSRAKA